MKSVICCVGIVLLWCLSICADDSDRPPTSAPARSPIAVEDLDPKLDHNEVSIKFAISELGGVAQLSIPGKAPTFVIEAISKHEKKDLTVWIEGELADVLDRLQLSFYGSTSSQVVNGNMGAQAPPGRARRRPTHVPGFHGPPRPRCR